MTEADLNQVRVCAESVFGCRERSDHGPAHWRRVEDTVLLIAPEVGGNLVVGRLFAVLHDCCRLDEGADPEHGRRAAALVRQLAGSLLRPLPGELLGLLIHAVHHHADGTRSTDPTIGVCWDADRLDLGRVGIIPSPEFMSTVSGREAARLGSGCLYRERNGLPTVPRNVREGPSP